jgi:hypothetical protein
MVKAKLAMVRSTKEYRASHWVIALLQGIQNQQLRHMFIVDIFTLDLNLGVSRG